MIGSVGLPEHNFFFCLALGKSFVDLAGKSRIQYRKTKGTGGRSLGLVLSVSLDHLSDMWH